MINITDEEEDEFDNFKSGFSSVSNDLTGPPFEGSIKSTSDGKSVTTDLRSSSPPHFDGPPPLTTNDFDGPPPLTDNDFDGPPPLTSNDFDENDDFVFPSALGRTQYTTFHKPQKDQQQENPADTTQKASSQDNNNNNNDQGFAAFTSASNSSDPPNQFGSTAFQDTKTSTTDNNFAAFANFSDDNSGKGDNNWFVADFKTSSSDQAEKDLHSDEKNDFAATFDDISTKPSTINFDTFQMAASVTPSKTEDEMKQNNNDSPSYTTTPPPFNDAFVDRQDSFDIGPPALTDLEKGYADTAFGFHNYKPPNLFKLPIDEEDNKADAKENVDNAGQSEPFPNKNSALSTHTVDSSDDAFGDFRSTSNNFNSNQDPKTNLDDSMTNTDNTNFSGGQFQANFDQQSSSQTDDIFSVNFDSQHSISESYNVDDSNHKSETKNDCSDQGNVGNFKTDVLQQQYDSQVKTSSSNDYNDDTTKIQSLKGHHPTEKQIENTEQPDFGDFSSVQQPTISKNLNSASIEQGHDSFANFEEFNTTQQNATEMATSTSGNNFSDFQSLKSTDVPADTKSSPKESSDNTKFSSFEFSKNNVSSNFDTPPPLDDMDDFDDDDFGDFKSLQTRVTNTEDKSHSIGTFNDEEDDDFSGFKTSRINTESQKQNTTLAVDDFDDFEGFKSPAVNLNAQDLAPSSASGNDTAFGNFQTPKDNFTTESNMSVTDDIDDEFGDFKSLPTPNATAKDGPSSLTKIDDEQDDDFGDFSNFKTSANQKSNTSPATDDFDDFGDFESSASDKKSQDLHQFPAKDNSWHKNSFDHASAVTVTNQFSQQTTSNLAMKVPTRITSSLIRETVCQTFKSQNISIVNGSKIQYLEQELINRNRSNKMWRTIIETEQDYNFVWKDSSNQKNLMDSVGVDLKALVSASINASKQAMKMDPLYGNNSSNNQSNLQNSNNDALEELNNFLGGAMLSPETKKPIPTTSTTSMSVPSTPIFDFFDVTKVSTESQNTKPEDSMQNNQFNIFSMTKEDSHHGKGLYEEDLMSLGISPLQTPVEEKSLESDATRFIALVRNKSTDNNENLSDEAKSIIEKLPDFSFMLSKSIMFPSLSNSG